MQELMFTHFTVTICNVKDNSQLTVGDLSKYTSDLRQVDKSLEQFLNLVTSQYVMFNSYVFKKLLQLKRWIL